MSMLDLTANHAVTTELLLHPLDWRARAVEQLEIASADRCLRRRSLQCAPLRTVLDRVASLGDAEEVFVVLHIATVPRGPLLDFDVEGPDGSSAFLLPRGEIAARQLDFLKAVMDQVPLRLTADQLTFVSALLSFPLDNWFHNGEPPIDVKGYLADGLGQEIDASRFSAWLDVAGECRRLLQGFCDLDGFNIVLDPLFALPLACGEGDGSSLEQAERLLTAYMDLVRLLCARDAPDSPVRDALNSLVDYGHSYDLLVAVKVPLDMPFMLKYQENRIIDFDLKQWGKQDVVLADANSNHVAVRVTDPNVRIKELRAEHPVTRAASFGTFTVAIQPSVSAFYAHGDDRDYRARLWLRLAPLRRLQLVQWLAFALVSAVAAVLWIEAPEGRDLALLAGPTALSATVLLAREPTTLGSRLRRIPSALLGIALAAMVVIALVLYLDSHGWIHDLEHRLTSVF